MAGWVLNKYLFLIVCSITLIGCNTGTMKKNSGKENTYVILIGLDGWGSYGIQNSEMPTVKRMMSNGSYTLTAKNIMPSSSACNWASMFMGASPVEHGYTEWNTQTPIFETPTDEHGFFPTIFALLKDQIPESKIGYFYEWGGIGYLCPPDVLDCMEQLPQLSANKEGVEHIGNYIKNEKPTLTLIVFDEPDHTGHTAGHDTDAYYAKLTELDGYIHIIEQAVKDAGIYNDTIFIFSADHGGIGLGHGGDTPEERQIPFIMYGKNIKKGYNILSSVMIYDIAPTIAASFNLILPDVWIGHSVNEVYKKE
ncbi:phosphodiesterase [Spirochaetia bacterium]|nr:phosphodiesterase [Spirochaetia bacterium]